MRRWRYEDNADGKSYFVYSTDPTGDMLAFTLTVGDLLARDHITAENVVRFITDAMNLHAL